MRKKMGRFRTLILLFFLVFVYCAVLLRSLNEGTRRSLRLRDDTDAADHIVISVLVTAVNPTTQELTAQISLRPQGALPQDEVTPAADSKLMINGITGRKEYDYHKAHGMHRREAVFPLNGDLNRYPFDHYETTVWILMTTPARKKPPQTSNIPESAE